jgi:hypothetical protein
MEDRIELHLGTDSEKLRAAIDAHREHIAAETLAVKWSETPVGETSDAKVDGQLLRIGAKKMS